MQGFWSKLLGQLYRREPEWSGVPFPVMVREDTGEWHVFESWLEMVAAFELLDLEDPGFRTWDAEGFVVYVKDGDPSRGEWEGERLEQLLGQSGPLSPAADQFRRKLPSRAP